MYFVEANLQMHELTIEGLDLFIVIKNYGQCISFFQLAYFRVKFLLISDSKTVSFTNLKRNNGKNTNNFCSLKIILCQCERLFSALYLSLSYYPVRVRRRAEGQMV